VEISMEKVNERSEARVSFRAPVSLRTPESGGAQSGELRNLSRRGMFVRVNDPPHVGAEILCEVAGQPPVRGRVAWVLRNTVATNDAGIGIALAEEAEPSLLEALVGLTFDETEPLELRFAGMPSALRATGRVSDTGIELTTPLAFLRTGAEVAITRGPGPERSLRARVASVRIAAEDGVPRLSISLSTVSSEMGSSAHEEIDLDDSRWFPEISIEEVPVFTMMEESAVEDAIVDPEPTQRTPHAMWQEPSSNVSEETAHIAPRSKAPGTGRWFVGAMLVLIGASVVWLMTGPTPTVAPAPQPAPAEAAKPEEAKVEVTTVPTTMPAPVELAKAVVTTPPEATPAPAPIAAMPAPAPAPVAASTPSAWQPNVVLNGNQASLTIPVTGAVKPLSTFTMSDPPGLAVDLPRGKTAVTLRSYLLHDGGFRSIWVRTRPTGAGLQIRLHYAKGTHVSAEPVEGGLRFRSH
jgi:Tfp pilus assembly protein PilZ